MDALTGRQDEDVALLAAVASLHGCGQHLGRDAVRGGDPGPERLQSSKEGGESHADLSCHAQRSGHASRTVPDPRPARPGWHNAPPSACLQASLPKAPQGIAPISTRI